MNLAKAASSNAYHSAMRAGLGSGEAKLRADQAKARVRAEVAAGDPIHEAFQVADRRRAQAMAEAARLRRERDALLITLADALGTSESEAWLIARLELEGDDD